jgi:16S rRNA (adenine1518-N6/adenine1519-N6)-dimethyltransferase
LIAVELDASLLSYLEEIPGIEILQQDIRQVDLKVIADTRKVRVVGNLPYYISTSILTFLLEHRESIQDMVLMFQEEVAERIIAPVSHSEYALMSVLAQYYCKIERGFPINKNCFVPRPEIQSRVLRFEIRQEPLIEYLEYMDFLRKAFSQKRKKLRNNLLRTLEIEPDQLDSVFQAMKISDNARAENLTPLQYQELILAIRPSSPRTSSPHL